MATTEQPPERAPDVQAAIDRATRELARRLEPWAAGMADPYAFARDYVEWQHEHGLKFLPRSGRIPEQGTRDPERAQRGAEYARELLAKTKTGDTE